MSKISLDEVEKLIQESIHYGKQSCRLPIDFELSKNAYQTLKETIENKIEDPNVNRSDIISGLVGYLRGYSEGLHDSGET